MGGDSRRGLVQADLFELDDVWMAELAERLHLFHTSGLSGSAWMGTSGCVGKWEVPRVARCSHPKSNTCVSSA